MFKKRPVLKLLAKTVVVALFASVFAFAISLRLEISLTDYLLTKYGNWKTPENIVIVTIDEDTLAKLPYRSPIDRTLLSKVIAKIDNAGAKAIGLDLLIDQPSERPKDTQFLTTIKNLKSPFVIGYANQAEGLTPKQVAFQKTYLKGVQKGLVTLLRDNFDGTVRQAFSGRTIDGKWQPGLAAAIAKAVGKKPPYPTGRITFYNNNANKTTGKTNGKTTSKTTDKKGTAKGNPFPFTTYPAHTVQFLPPAWFKDKIVLIGPTLPAQDRHATAFTTTKGTTVGNLYGVMIHAHILNQFLNGDQISKPGALITISIVIGLSLIAAIVASSKITPLQRLVIIALLIMLFGYVAFYLFRTAHIQIPFVTPIFAAIFASLFFAMRQWFKDREQRQFIEKAFSHYVSPAIVTKIIANHKKLELGGELRQVTYIFTDLQNFTALSESMEPTQVAGLLNDYLDQMCALFVEADATIDKIIGDAVVGFFGAPQPQEDQADRAVQLALKIEKFSQDFKHAQNLKGINFGNTRIGIHKGDAIIGNFGGKRFMDYTGIGDTVNTAARLESANKHFGTRICVSQTVRAACQSVQFRPIGDIILKGKQEAVTCFEPIVKTATGTTAQETHLQEYNKAYALMAGNKKDAPLAFFKLADKYNTDPLINFHANRLRQGNRGVTIELKGK